MIRRLLIITFVLALAGFAFAASNDQPDAAAPDSSQQASNVSTGQQGSVPSLKQRNPRYILQRGDVVVLDFPFTPEFNETVTVQPDGYINVRSLDDIHVEGMTAPELQESLKKAYSKILHDPAITVTLQTFVSPYFVVNGEVGHPGKFDLHGDTTLTEAIAIAGGFTPNAKHSQVVLFRRVSNEWVSAQTIDVKHMLKSGSLAEDLHLQPGDMLFVPKNLISKIQPYLPLNTFRASYGFVN